MGKNVLGIEVTENYDQGAGQIDVLWTGQIDVMDIQAWL